jgi:hypothetical protein
MDIEGLDEDMPMAEEEELEEWEEYADSHFHKIIE